MFFFLINALISFGIFSTPKESKYVTLLLFTCKATQWVPISEYSSRFIIHAASFISVKLCSGKLSREKTPLNLGSFWQYFCISKFVKGWDGIKNPICFHNQLLQFVHLLYLFLYLFLLYIFLILDSLLSLLFELKGFLINLHLLYLITY